MSRLEKRRDQWEKQPVPDTLEAAEEEFLEELDAQINELQVRSGYCRFLILYGKFTVFVKINRLL